jgi:hypothetical protein
MAPLGRPSSALVDRKAVSIGSSPARLLSQCRNRCQPFLDGRQNALFAHKKALLFQAFLKAGVLKALLRFFKAREQAEALLDQLHFALYVRDPPARAFQFKTQFCLMRAGVRIALDETLQEKRQLLAALGQLGDLVLAEYLDAGDHVSRGDRFRTLPNSSLTTGGLGIVRSIV